MVRRSEDIFGMPDNSRRIEGDQLKEPWTEGSLEAKGLKVSRVQEVLGEV